MAGNDDALKSLETTFNQDLNGDGTIGATPIVIPTDTNAFGSTKLTEVGDEFFLYNASGSGPVLQDGAPVLANQFGDWVPIGAAPTASGYDVAWENPEAAQYNVWSTDSNGNYVSDTGVLAGNDPALESIEPIFNQDLNGDGTIGLTRTVIQTDTTSFGSTSLTEVAHAEYMLLGASGSGPVHCNSAAPPLLRATLGPGCRSARCERPAGTILPGKSQVAWAVTSTRCGAPIAMAITSQISSAWCRETTMRCSRSRRLSTKT